MFKRELKQYVEPFDMETQKEPEDKSDDDDEPVEEVDGGDDDDCATA
jgi:hypothetical protein